MLTDVAAEDGDAAPVLPLGELGPSLGSKPVDDNKGKLFIGGLSWETTQEGLRGYFAQFGEVTDCVVMINPHTRRSRGFGFITFADPDVAAQVIADGKHSLDNREIDPKPAVPKGGAPRGRKAGRPREPATAPVKTKKIFVGGLTPDTTQESLTEFFSGFGTVDDVILMYDRETRRPRGSFLFWLFFLFFCCCFWKKAEVRCCFSTMLKPSLQSTDANVLDCSSLSRSFLSSPLLCPPRSISSFGVSL